MVFAWLLEIKRVAEDNFSIQNPLVEVFNEKFDERYILKSELLKYEN